MDELLHVASPQARMCLRLHLIDGVGPLRFKRLVDHFGGVQAVLEAGSRHLAAVPTIGPALVRAIDSRRDESQARRELQRAAKCGARILCQADPEYPALLKETPDAPVCLYLTGRLLPQDRGALAIVGSRRCSMYGREHAHHFALAAGRAGMTVVSGMARGVDAQAHLGALDCAARTIAVLGSGIGHLRRHHNAELADRIIGGGGAILSELPIDRPPEPANFPPRNRIIAGMSLGTVVVEAARRSGALITARLAGEYNREVFAVPGRVDNDYAAGTNALIQSGQAKLVGGIGDILEELRHAAPQIVANYQDRARRADARVAPHLTADERTILRALSREGTDLEEICNCSGLPPEKISSGLTVLQLKGVVEQLPGNRFCRVGLPAAGARPPDSGV